MCPKATDSHTVQGIIDLHKAGHTVNEISELKGLSKRTVRHLIKKFKDGGGVEIPKPKKAPGRRPKTSERTRNVLKRQIEVNPSLTAREIKEQNPLLLHDVSIRCVQETLKRDLGYRSFRARKKPLINERQKKKRVEFAKAHKDWTLEQWRTVLWSDESTFCVSGRTFSRVRRKEGSDPNLPKFTQKTTKHPQSLMVWGCFTYYGLGDLVILPPNTSVNKKVYLELLWDHLEPSFEATQAVTFQQDGAPCHTAKEVTQWFEDCHIPLLKPWPGNSPDISPIENLWAIIKAKLRGRDTSSLPKLEAEIRKCWEDFKPEVMQNLADSVPKRLRDVIKKKGNAIKY